MRRFLLPAVLIAVVSAVSAAAAPVRGQRHCRAGWLAGSVLGQNPGLIRFCADGRSWEQLTHGIDRDPAWDPSGRYIAFERTSKDGRVHGIYLFDLRTKKVVRLNAPGDAETPAWKQSRADRSITYATLDGIYTLTPPQNHPRLILPFRGPESPAWSPSGRVIAFDKSPGSGISQGGILAFDTKTERITALTALANDKDPDWSSDGQSLAFARLILPSRHEPARRGALSQIAIVNVKNRRVHVVAASNNHLFSQPVWSPSHHSLAFIQAGPVLNPAQGASVMISLGQGSTLPRQISPPGLSIGEAAWQPR
jgi:Tol biopolymer transport system component